MEWSTRPPVSLSSPFEINWRSPWNHKNFKSYFILLVEKVRDFFFKVNNIGRYKLFRFIYGWYSLHNCCYYFSFFCSFNCYYQVLKFWVTFARPHSDIMPCVIYPPPTVCGRSSCSVLFIYPSFFGAVVAAAAALGWGYCVKRRCKVLPHGPFRLRVKPPAEPLSTLYPPCHAGRVLCL